MIHIEILRFLTQDEVEEINSILGPGYHVSRHMTQRKFKIYDGSFDDNDYPKMENLAAEFSVDEYKFPDIASWVFERRNWFCTNLDVCIKDEYSIQAALIKLIL